MIEEAHTKWALLSSPALFLNASAMAALSTADALKQEGRRALVVGADKAKLASLALGRPETMVGEGGELVLRAQGPARRWGGGRLSAENRGSRGDASPPSLDMVRVLGYQVLEPGRGHG